MKKTILYIISTVMMLSMVGMSVLLNEKEIIFPEIAALVIGGWLCEKQPWKVSKPKFLFLMTISSIFGIFMVKCVPLPLDFKIIIAFLFTAIMLMIFKSTMLPMISACILPIIMGTESVVYPISVFVMTLIIILVRLALEKAEIKTKPSETIYNYSLKTELLRWLLLTIIFVPMCFAATKSGWVFIIAPPLIVTFTEFSFTESSVVKSPIKIMLTIAICSIIGAYSRLIFEIKLGFPLILVTCIIILLMFVTFFVSKKLFPPAGAIAFLPLIIPSEKLLFYPLLIIVGSTIFISLAIMIGKILNEFVSKQEKV